MEYNNSLIRWKLSTLSWQAPLIDKMDVHVTFLWFSRHKTFFPPYISILAFFGARTIEAVNLWLLILIILYPQIKLATSLTCMVSSIFSEMERIFCVHQKSWCKKFTGFPSFWIGVHCLLPIPPVIPFNGFVVGTIGKRSHQEWTIRHYLVSIPILGALNDTSIIIPPYLHTYQSQYYSTLALRKIDGFDYAFYRQSSQFGF